MPKLRVRAKKMMRKKYKKTIKLRDLDKVWKDWVEYRIIRHIIKYGSVQVDDDFKIEIIGKNITSDKRLMDLLSKGTAVSKKGFKMAANKLGNRPGIIYKIVASDRSYGGQLIFQPSKNFRKAVREHLTNTNQVYPIK